MITKLVLQNFKTFRDRTEIDLAPITLLYGQNSAGKSSLLHALLYAYEVLANDWCDVDQTTLSQINLGGFWNLLNRTADEPSITIGLGYSQDSDPTYCFDVIDTRDIELVEQYFRRRGCSLNVPFGDGNIANFYVEVKITWDDNRSRPLVSRLAISFDGGAPLIVMEPDAQSEHVALTYLDFDGRFLAGDYPGDGSSLGDLIRTLQKQAGRKATEPELIIRGPASYGAKPPLDRQIIVHPSQNLGGGSIYDELSALRKNHRPSRPSAAYLRKEEELGRYHEDLIWLSRFFDFCIRKILQLLTDSLERLVHIGPMRNWPDRSASLSTRVARDRWHSGLGAWDAVLQASEEDFERVNSWLQRLKTGYSITRQAYAPVSSSKAVAVSGARLSDWRSVRKLVFVDSSGNEFDAQDLGTGVSQIFPIVVAACLSDIGVVVVEQPELHIHPALQVELGDLLISSMNRKLGLLDHVGDKFGAVGIANAFIVETHSEHLILRLLRRIRETSNGEAQDRSLAILPEEIAVLYLQRTDTGTKVMRLRVDAEGDFIDHWPDGFFAERGEELF